jgi:hypothetical protein
MRPIWLVVGTALCAEPALTAPREGKVVRIERRPRSIAGTPRLCEPQQGTPQHGGPAMWVCFGPTPEVGDRIRIVDNSRLLGTLRISHVAPYDGCAQSSLWNVVGAVEGDLPKSSAYGAIDVEIEPRGHLVTTDHLPSTLPAVDQIVALDADGDDAAEIVFARYTCDGAGNPSATPTGVCVDVLAISGGNYERLRQDRIKACY